MPDEAKISGASKRSLIVEGFTNSVLDPNKPMLGPVKMAGQLSRTPHQGVGSP